MSDERSIPAELLRVFRQVHFMSRNPQRPTEGITPSELRMLFAIRSINHADPKGIKASGLSQLMNVTMPTVTQSVNVLEAKGLLERKPDPDDRRIVRIKITEEGLRRLEQIHSNVFSGFEKLTQHMGEERSLLLIELMDEAFRFFNDGADSSRCPGTGPKSSE